MNLDDNAHLVRYPWDSAFYVCRICETHIVQFHRLISLTFIVLVDLQPIYDWSWEQDGIFDHLDNVYLIDIPNDEFDIIEVECLGCGTNLGERMAHEPGHYTIKMDRLLYRYRGLTSSPLVWLEPAHHRRWN